jgi:hypothetical protein
MLKSPLKYERDIVWQSQTFPSSFTPALLLDNSAGGTARELWRKNQEFFPVGIIRPWFSMDIYHLGNKQ